MRLLISIVSFHFKTTPRQYSGSHKTPRQFCCTTSDVYTVVINIVSRLTLKMSSSDSEDNKEAVKKGSSRDKGKCNSSKTLTHRKASSSSGSHGGKKSSSMRKRNSPKSSSSDRRHPAKQRKHKKNVTTKSSSRHSQKGTQKRSVNRKKASSVSPSTSSKRAKAEAPKKKHKVVHSPSTASTTTITSPESRVSSTKRGKVGSPKKIRKVVHSPSTASTTTIRSPESRVSSTGTVVTSKSTDRRDRETSAKLKKLSMSNNKTSKIKSTSIKSPPNIVYKRSSDVDVDYLSANWVDEDHLYKLKESKQKEWTEDDKKQFLELSLKEKNR